jgi:Pectate lyase superfamily protein
MAYIKIPHRFNDVCSSVKVALCGPLRRARLLFGLVALCTLLLIPTLSFAAARVSVNVTDFGAVGDNNTYNDSAINDAVKSGATLIIFPEGQFRVRHPINLTNHSGGAITFRGSGNSDSGVPGTSIVGDTGNCIIDTTGSQFITIEDLSLVSGNRTGATCGIYLARSTDVKYSQFNSIKNVTISLPHEPSANNGHGTIGIYNYGSEIFRVSSVVIHADQGITLFNDNLYNLYSSYVPIISGQTGMSVVDIGGPSALFVSGGPGISLFNTWNVHIGPIFITTPPEGNSYPYAIETMGATSITDLQLNVESFKQLMKITGNQVNMHLHAGFNGRINDGASYIVMDGTGSACTSIQNSEIDVSTIDPASSSHYLLDYTGSNVCGVKADEIYLTHREGINMPKGWFSSTVHSVDSAPTMNLPPADYHAYVLLTGQGTMKIAGNVNTSTSPTATPGAGAVANTVTGSSGCKILSGAGDPNGLQVGSVCDMYLNSTGGSGSTLYVKQSGTNTNAGWAAK